MDLLKEEANIIDNKKLLPENDTVTEMEKVIFFIDADKIVYIGRTKLNALQYVLSKVKSFHCTHYNYKEVETDTINEYMAEMILYHQPMYNTKIPSNKLYISNNMAKDIYPIDKRGFRKLSNQYGGYAYGNLLYVKEQVLIDIYGPLIKYHQYMPELDSKIVLEYYDDHFLQTGYYQEHERNDLEEGGREDVIRHLSASPMERYKQYQEIMSNTYTVIKCIDEIKFIVKSDLNGKTTELNANDRNWKKVPGYETERLILEDIARVELERH